MPITFIQTTPDQTPIQKAQAMLSAQANSVYRFNLTAVKTLFNLVWNHPDQVNCSPDLVWTVLGTNAVFLRHVLTQATTSLNLAVPGSLTLTEPKAWTVVENNDGTITATKTG